MQRELGKDILDVEKRMAFLADNCDSQEVKTYMRRFSSDELLVMKDGLSNVAIQIDEIEAEKKASMEIFKEQLKPLSDEKKRILDGLKSKSEQVKATCYKFIDAESREVGFYTKDGDLIESRPAFIDELQTTIYQIQRNGTDN